MSNLPLYTIAGAGYFGTGLLGNLFADGRLQDKAKLVAYVDPQPDLSDIRRRKIGKNPGVFWVKSGKSPKPRFHIPGTPNPIPIFQNIQDWASKYSGQIQNMIVDLALYAKHAPGALSEYIGLGVKQIVIPKPFTFDTQRSDSAVKEVDDHQVKTAVTSNWYYSDITKTLKDKIAEATREDGYTVEKAHVEYSTQLHPESLRHYIPTHTEFPHALQILVSTGLIDPVADANKVQITQATSAAVGVNFSHPKGATGSVSIHSSLDQRSNSSTGRTRKLEIWLNDGDPQADIIGDYDIKFNARGEFVGSGWVIVDTPKRKIKEEFKEDTMALMYQKIITAFKSPFESFQKDPNILTLKDYNPIIHLIAKIHGAWQAKSGNYSEH